MTVSKLVCLRAATHAAADIFFIRLIRVVFQTHVKKDDNQWRPVERDIGAVVASSRKTAGPSQKKMEQKNSLAKENGGNKQSVTFQILTCRDFRNPSHETSPLNEWIL